MLTKKHIQRIYSKADKACSSIENCCDKGCAHCCHQSIEILHWEIQPIVDWIKENLSQDRADQIAHNLKEWATYFRLNTPPKEVLGFDDLFVDFHEQAGKDRFPCPFLLNNECAIYQCRPLVCRMHLIKDQPDLCKEHQLRNSIDEAFQYKIKLLREISSQYDSYLVLLPIALSPAFGIELPMKKIVAMTVSLE